MDGAVAPLGKRRALSSRAPSSLAQARVFYTEAKGSGALLENRKGGSAFLGVSQGA